MQHYAPFKWWLLPHGIAGACALLLGPMQFSEQLRQRYARLHRVVGRIYVGGVFVAAPLGTYIQYFNERTGAPRSLSFAAGADMALWMITTGIALMFTSLHAGFFNGKPDTAFGKGGTLPRHVRAPAVFARYI